MTPERWQQVKHALGEALGLTADERRGYLERVGANDPELRQEIESMLAEFF